MATITTSRPVNLAQLATELAGAPLSAATTGGQATVTCHDDTVTEQELQAAVDAHTPRIPPDPQAVRAAADAVAAMVVADRIAAQTLTVPQATAVAAAFPMWAPGQTIAAGDLRYHDGLLVEAIQPHTTQADWTPPDVPALWKVWRDPDVVEAWVQPQGAHDSYAAGALVTHEGKTWESNVDSNVWEPPTQWTEVG